jgi:Sec7-like guanine-nucleotide exchange factor
MQELKGVNGGGNFGEECLMETFDPIRKEEIVKPAEHLGSVKDAHPWKVLPRR